MYYLELYQGREDYDGISESLEFPVKIEMERIHYVYGNLEVFYKGNRYEITTTPDGSIPVRTATGTIYYGDFSILPKVQAYNPVITPEAFSLMNNYNKSEVKEGYAEISKFETHFLVVENLLALEEKATEILRQDVGIRGLMPIAKEITEEFETSFYGKEWDGEWDDYVEAFVNTKVNAIIREKTGSPDYQLSPTIEQILIREKPDLTPIDTIELSAAHHISTHVSKSGKRYFFENEKGLYFRIYDTGIFFHNDWIFASKSENEAELELAKLLSE